MKIVFGVSLYGRINGKSGTYRVTRFAHLCYLPLFPLGTLRGHGENERNLGRTTFSVLSMLVGYFKVYGFFGALLLAFHAQKEIRQYGNLEAAPLGALAIALMTAVVVSWFWVGARPSRKVGKRVIMTLLTMVPFVGLVTALFVNAMLTRPRSTYPRFSLAALTPTPLPEVEGLGSAARTFPLYLRERGIEGVREPLTGSSPVVSARRWPSSCL